MEIGKPQRVIIVEPLELPTANPDHRPDPEPSFPPERESAEPVVPEKVAVARYAKKKPYRNQYKCLYGNKDCGENAVYCEPCNKRYEHFLWLMNDDR